jgi:hypothetical protein
MATIFYTPMPRPGVTIMTKSKSADCPNRDKGSYRHMLDLVSAPNFRGIIDGLLAGIDARLAQEDHRHPCGRSKKRDWVEIELEDYLKRHPLPGYTGLNRRWWIAFNGKRPTWDLICHVEVDEKPGLLVVEAKARCGEMGEKDSKSAVDKKNDRSIANDLSIRLRLAEASLGLNELGLGNFRLSTDHDYQLSNRLAYLYKLASDGVPTILMYLGWIGSPDWTTAPLVDESAWTEAVKGHFSRIGPWEFVGTKRHFATGASLQMIVRGIHWDVLR